MFHVEQTKKGKMTMAMIENNNNLQNELQVDMGVKSLAQWRAIYSTLTSQGFESVATIETGVGVEDGDINRYLLEALDEYPMDQYQHKYEYTNRQNIIVFVRAHKVKVFKEEARRFGEVAERMKASMHNAGFKFARYLIYATPGLMNETMNSFKGHECQWVDFQLTKYQSVKALYVKEIELQEPIGEEFLEEIAVSRGGEYKKRIVNRVDKQMSKGVDKYPTILEDSTNLGFNERLDHLADELTDGLQYIEHLRDGYEQTIQRQIELTTLLTGLASKLTGKNREEALRLSRLSNDITKELIGIAKN